jgi:hypothetical protein
MFLTLFLLFHCEKSFQSSLAEYPEHRREIIINFYLPSFSPFPLRDSSSFSYIIFAPFVFSAVRENGRIFSQSNQSTQKIIYKNSGITSFSLRLREILPLTLFLVFLRPTRRFFDIPVKICTCTSCTSDAGSGSLAGHPSQTCL